MACIPEDSAGESQTNVDMRSEWHQITFTKNVVFQRVATSTSAAVAAWCVSTRQARRCVVTFIDVCTHRNTSCRIIHRLKKNVFYILIFILVYESSEDVHFAVRITRFYTPDSQATKLP